MQTADGTLLTVAVIGSIHVETIGLLSRVLHMPKLFMSIVSAQIAKLDEYRIIFDDTNVFL